MEIVVGLSVLRIMSGYEKSLTHLPELKQDEVELIAFKITTEQLEQLAPCVKKLDEVTEKICKAKIESCI